eukprot:GDKJ01001840.1.p1 GENE.GDKJ01001840.1~~GDKJ01001840.1.p1  ORF type:complete len:1007 (+),score=281.03 GDKJ01001840.1:36-3056(+)
MGETIIPVDGPKLSDFKKEGLTTQEVESLRMQYGFNEVTVKEVAEWKVFLRRFFNLVPVIMIITAALCMAVQEGGKRDSLGFAILVFTLFLMVCSAHYSDRNARSALDAVRKMGTPKCHVRRNGELVEIPTREVIVGDVIAMRAGTIIPADGLIIGEGVPMAIDESALTGETIAATKGTGDSVMAGAIIQRGELDIVVTAIGDKSSYGKTIALIGSVQSPGHLRLVLQKAAFTITGTGAIFCVAIFVVALARDGRNVGNSFKLAFVILSAIAPSAMPVVTATVLAVGARTIAAESALVQRLSSIEEMAGMEILCSDKTGTLTLNQLTLHQQHTHCEPGYTNESVLLYAALASNVEHAEPIDKAVIGTADMQEWKKWTIHHMVPFDPINKKVIVDVTSPQGKRFRVIKGAPHIMVNITASPAVLGASQAAAEAERQHEIIHSRAALGLRTLGVAIEVEKPTGPGVGLHDVGVCKLVGYISLHDPPRPDTKMVIQEAAKLGVEVKMITGDQLAIAIETCRSLGMGTQIASSEVFSQNTDAKPFMGHENFSKYCESVAGFAGVFPEHKFRVVQALMEGGNLIGMTGDGVNDAPALKAATVGIAVDGATEAAQAAADIVLKKPGLSTIITAIKLSRQIFRRIESYITYRIASSTFILFFFFLTQIAFNFYFPTWVILFISIVNDVTIIFTSRDNVPTSMVPLHWDMLKAAVIGATVGLVGTAAGILLFLCAHPNYINWWDAFGLGNAYQWNDNWSAQQKEEMEAYVVSALYVCIGIIIQTNFIACRARRIWCKFDSNNLFPNWMVTTAMTLSILLTFVLAIHMPEKASVGVGGLMSGLKFLKRYDNNELLDPSGLKQALLVCAYSFLWFILVDIVKTLMFMYWDRTFILDPRSVVYVTDPKSESALEHKKVVRAHKIENQIKSLESSGGVQAKATEQQQIISRLASTSFEAGHHAAIEAGRVVVENDDGFLRVKLKQAEEKNKVLEIEIQRLNSKVDEVAEILKNMSSHA